MLRRLAEHKARLNVALQDASNYIRARSGLPPMNLPSYDDLLPD